MLEQAERMGKEIARLQAFALPSGLKDVMEAQERDLRSRFGAAQANEHASIARAAGGYFDEIVGNRRLMTDVTEALRQASAGDHLEALMNNVLGDRSMAEIFPPPSVNETLEQAMDEVLRLTSIESSASFRTGLDALDTLPDPARLASDLGLNAAMALPETGMLAAQTAEMVAALDAPRAHLETLLGSLAQQIEEVMPLPTAPFQNTLRQMLNDHQAIQFDPVFAANHASQELARVLETAGLDPWIEALQRALDQPDWFELVAEFETGGGLADPGLQSEFAEALFEQPDWRALVERTASPSVGQGDTGTTPSTAVKPKGWRMLRQFARVRGALLRSREESASRSGFVRDLVLFGLGTLYTTFLNHSTESKVDVLLEIAHKPSAQISLANQKGHWALGAGASMRLNTSPLKGAAQTEAHTGPIRLIETESRGDWVEVTVHDCNGKKGSGWIRRSALEQLDSTAEPTCPADHGPVAPVLIVEAGARAQEAWQEFFLAKLPNPNTRLAYGRACTHYFDWCRAHGLVLQNIRPAQVAIWRDELAKEKSTATVKQYLTAVRRLLDELVINQVIEVNPAHPVRAPRLSRARTRTASLSALELRQLFAAFDTSQIIDIRDRAVLAVMTFYMARVSAVCSMPVKDIELGGEQPHMILNEKRGRQHRLPLNTTMVEWIVAWVEAAGISRKVDAPLFQSFGQGRGTSEVTGRQLGRQDVYSIVRRRFEKAGLDRRGGCHTLRATGITLLLSNGTPIEQVSELAGHASVDMTRRYDGRDWEEVQKVLGKMG